MEYLLAGSSFIFTLLLIPLVKRMSEPLGLIDEPSRGIHEIPTPRSGGIAVIGAVGVSLFLLTLRGDSFLKEPRVGYVIAGFLSVFILGLLDDVFDLRARYKMSFLILIALLVSFLYKPTNIPAFALLLNSLICTLLFLGAVNGVNFIDGMDGLAPGLCFLSFFSFFFLLSSIGDRMGALLALSCAFALFGFLFYNWHPATIFIGDAGNFALGFLLAFLGYRLWLGSPNFPTLVAILFLLLVPAYDLILTVVRRLLNKRPLFQGDLHHSYHKLWRDWGWKYTDVVIFFLALQAVFSLFAISIFFHSSYCLALILLTLTILGAVIFTLHYGLTSFEKINMKNR